MTTKGPVFDGRAERHTRDFTREAGREVADEGKDTVLAEFARDVQHPTGRYASSLHVVNYGSRHEVTDGGMVYGPWLAGVGSRNKKSRFKGYTFWRRSTQLLQRRTPQIVQRLLPNLMRRLNG
ncbi:hypothetical protein UK23_29520 [Lentzea aerocolonigenes]|uniref:HK97 gp10 family phage protein n=2 Tax=Lentzea aerocolonigenes TaxID=68170 RepID=A0A0F0GPG0_LENAE|nr:hypothetical protein UK23_29520 [Lentzea aerocolonigenes]